MLRLFLCFSLISSVIALACSQKTSSVIKDSSMDAIEAVLIHASSGTLGPCEPTICINSANSQNVVAGAVLDNVYVSNDGGKSWTKDRLKSSYGVYGDPVIRSDYDGNFYYAHLSNPDGGLRRSEAWLDRIVIQKSEDGGQSWNDGSYTKPRSPKDQDKHWLAIDPEDNTVYITWTEFDLYGSKKSSDKSRILFSKSIDGGASWTDPLRINQFEGDCIDDDQTPEGAVPCVGLNGEVYVAWSYDNKIYFDKSLDGGQTWMEEDIVVAEQPGGWSIDIPGIARCNGMPITGIDRSGGPNHGTLYINWSDQRNGEEDTDIWLTYSNDNGQSWSEPTRVNDDKAGSQQFLTWMSIDESTGYIYTVFYDRRHHDDNTTDVYLAYSTDGGKSFTNKKINSRSFLPNPNVFFGDYNDISVKDGMVRPIWTQLNKDTLSVWTALIDF
ncbi:MAG: exo-alpha-sialidase [Saprospiraceae bacterium]|nr:exo-alpha-sialidase [Saprospiraceae bacterium]